MTSLRHIILTTLFSAVGAAAAVVTTALAVDARYVKSGEFADRLVISGVAMKTDVAESVNQAKALAYAMEMRRKIEQAKFLHYKLATGEIGRAERALLTDLQNDLRRMSNHDWPEMADDSVQNQQ